MMKISFMKAVTAFLLALIPILGSCRQTDLDEFPGWDGREPKTVLRSPHPVRFSLEASFDSGKDEAQQEGRFLLFYGNTRRSVERISEEGIYRRTLDHQTGEYGEWEKIQSGDDSEDFPFGESLSPYPLLWAQGSADTSSPGNFREVKYELGTHIFIFGFDESSSVYHLEGYTQLTWTFGQEILTSSAERIQEVPLNDEGTLAIHNRIKTSNRHYMMTLKAEKVVDVHKASYNADRSEMLISEDEFLSLEKGKKYRILAINDDGGFDPKRASLADYPEAATPMFYFAKGGNSPLPAATTYNRRGSSYPDQGGIVAYGMELDYTPEVVNLVKLGTDQKVEFYPLSPLLKLGISMKANAFEDDASPNQQRYHSPYVLASSCLTQNFAYTISGVDEVGAIPSFKTILKVLQAEGYAWTGSPIEGTTYEPLLVPYLRPSRNATTAAYFYLPLEPRYKELSSLDQQATFVVPQTGEQITGDLLADHDLYFCVYVREDDSEKLHTIKENMSSQGEHTYKLYRYRDGVLQGQTNMQRLGFNLSLARGTGVRDKAEAVELFWRNDRQKKRYNMNNLTFYVGEEYWVGAANQL